MLIYIPETVGKNNVLDKLGLKRLRKYYQDLSKKPTHVYGDVFEKIYQDGRTDALMELYEKLKKEVINDGR